MPARLADIALKIEVSYAVVGQLFHGEQLA